MSQTERENLPDVESRILPVINVIPNTPPANPSGDPVTTFSELYDTKSDELVGTGLQSRASVEYNRHVHYSSEAVVHDGPSRLSVAQNDSAPNQQQQILTALAVGVSRIRIIH